jgi:hypothetical protein
MIPDRLAIPDSVERRARFAYVTLMHGVDESLKYRGFLFSAIIMKTILSREGSQADFLVMVGFSRNSVDKRIFDSDAALLERFGLKIIYLPRLVPNVDKVSFAEMALLKITPWSMLEYERVQYFDGDIMPSRSLDTFFGLEMNAFNTGKASPVNSGWFLAVPNMQTYEYLKSKAITRLLTPWNEEFGWNERIPADMRFRGDKGSFVKKWTFNGASLDQGLLTHTLVINNGSVVLFDINFATVYAAQYRATRVRLGQALTCCGGESPVNYFDHFTGMSKPWLEKNIKSGDASVLRWLHELDSLNLPINSSNIHLGGGLKSPLGYWHPNK